MEREVSDEDIVTPGDMTVMESLDREIQEYGSRVRARAEFAREQLARAERAAAKGETEGDA